MSRVVFLQLLPIPRPAVMQLAAVLRCAGHGCDVVVASEERDAAAAARRLRPDLLALSCMTGEHAPALALAARARATLPGVPVIMGGPHPTCCPDVALHPALDAACRGEGEEALLDVARAVDRGDALDDIPNLVLGRGGRLRQNPLRPLVAELDSLPPPHHRLYARYRHLGLSMHNPMVLTGRGCPYDCTFCCNHHQRQLYGVTAAEHVRRRSPEGVLAELADLTATHPVRVVEIIDDTFTLQRPWLRRFLPEYARRVGLPFACDVRADTLDEEVVALLGDAGCAAVRMSVESGDDRLRQEVLGKRLSRRTLKRAARLVKARGIRLLTYNMVGAPGETLDMALQTLALNRKLRPDYAWCALLQPYPGTRVRRLAEEQGLLRPAAGDDVQLPQTVFSYAPVGGPDRPALESLQRLFHLLVRAPVPMPVVRRLLRRRPGALHDLVFKLSYASYLRDIEGMPLADLLRAGLSAHDSFVSRREDGP